MHGKKIIQLLRTFSKKELNQAEKFLNVFHSSKEQILKLYYHLMQFHGRWDSPKLQVAKVREELDITISSKAFSNRHSKLYKLLLDYLIAKELDKSESQFDREMLVIDILARRKAHHLRKQETESLAKDVKQPKLLDFWHPIDLIRINEEFYYSDESNKYNKDNQLLQLSLETLETFSQGLKLKYGCELLWRSIILGLPPDENLADELLKLKVNPTNHHHYIYHVVFQALYHKELELFNQTFELLVQYKEQLKEIDRLIILIYLINFAARESHIQLELYGQRLLKLYLYGLEERILMDKNQISRIRFHNIVEVMAKLKQVDDARSFIEDYSPFLLPTERLNTVLLAECIILFVERKYDEVNKKIQAASLKTLDEKFRARSLILACQYETLGEDETTWHTSKAFKVFLDRKKTEIYLEFIKAFKNFVRIVEQLMKQETPKSELEDKILGEERIILRFWLLEKLKDYKQKY